MILTYNGFHQNSFQMWTFLLSTLMWMLKKQVASTYLVDKLDYVCHMLQSIIKSLFENNFNLSPCDQCATPGTDAGTAVGGCGGRRGCWNPCQASLSPHLNSHQVHSLLHFHLMRPRVVVERQPEGCGWKSISEYFLDAFQNPPPPRTPPCRRCNVGQLVERVVFVAKIPKLFWQPRQAAIARKPNRFHSKILPEEIGFFWHVFPFSNTKKVEEKSRQEEGI